MNRRGAEIKGLKFSDIFATEVTEVTEKIKFQKQKRPDPAGICFVVRR